MRLFSFEKCTTNYAIETYSSSLLIDFFSSSSFLQLPYSHLIDSDRTESFSAVIAAATTAAAAAAAASSAMEQARLEEEKLRVQTKEKKNQSEQLFFFTLVGKKIRSLFRCQCLGWSEKSSENFSFSKTAKRRQIRVSYFDWSDVRNAFAWIEIQIRWKCFDDFKANLF